MKTAYIINTKGRPEIFKKKTWRWLKYLDQSCVYVTVEPHEVDLYESIIKSRKANIMVLPASNRGLTWTRRYCQLYFGKKYDRLWLLDDNITAFYKRNENDYQKSTRMTEKECAKMFQTLTGFMKSRSDKYGQLGISFKASNWQHSKPFKEISRVWAITLLNNKLLLKNGILYDKECTIQQDYDITLQMFRKGIRNYVTYRYIFDKSMSKEKGGCQTYRTKELSRQVMSYFKRKYPQNFVNTFYNKSHDLYELKIQWKKAFVKKENSLLSYFSR